MISTTFHNETRGPRQGLQKRCLRTRVTTLSGPAISALPMHLPTPTILRGELQES